MSDDRGRQGGGALRPGNVGRADPHADPATDLTGAVTAELDRLITAPVSVTPPANWQPGQQQQQAAPAAAQPAAKPATQGR